MQGTGQFRPPHLASYMNFKTFEVFNMHLYLRVGFYEPVVSDTISSTLFFVSGTRFFQAMKIRAVSTPIEMCPP